MTSETRLWLIPSEILSNLMSLLASRFVYELQRFKDCANGIRDDI